MNIKILDNEQLIKLTYAYNDTMQTLKNNHHNQDTVVDIFYSCLSNYFKTVEIAKILKCANSTIWNYNTYLNSRTNNNKTIANSIVRYRVAELFTLLLRMEL